MLGGYCITDSALAVTQVGTVNAGANQATAAHFVSGDNRLTLENGYTGRQWCKLNGNNDVLALGGSADGTFDTSLVGTDASDIFRRFESFEKPVAAPGR
ncbi:hypothetical protein AU15_02820 [Marinobacter salarius]|uniref:Uncharacterized protein n=1 Tax=Marinobacter salarius TaxID=1420917 RepID=W5YVA3_9GAMM|nr:hypothetical protein AU15_02820 [Marinobacter salarius]